MSKVPEAENDRWVGEKGMVVFKFWAAEFPGVKRFTGNNPSVV